MSPRRCARMHAGRRCRNSIRHESSDELGLHRGNSTYSSRASSAKQPSRSECRSEHGRSPCFSLLLHDLPVAEWHLRELEEHLQRRGWQAVDVREGDGVPVSATWELDRGGSRLLLDFKVDPELTVRSLERSYAVDVRDQDDCCGLSAHSSAYSLSPFPPLRSPRGRGAMRAERRSSVWQAGAWHSWGPRFSWRCG
jgi:hypothetical protein